MRLLANTIDYIALIMDWSPCIFLGHSVSLSRNFTHPVSLKTMETVISIHIPIKATAYSADVYDL